MKGNKRNGRKPRLRNAANKTNGMEKRRIFFLHGIIAYYQIYDVVCMSSKIFFPLTM